MTTYHRLLRFTYSRLLLRILFSLVALYVIPLLLYQIDSPWLSFSYTKERSIFEYLGFAGTCCLLSNGFSIWKRWSSKTDAEKYFLIAFFLFASFQLILFSELSTIGNDYYAYQESVRAIINQQSPYTSAYTMLHPYIYPPLLAQSMTLLFRLISRIWYVIFGLSIGEDNCLFFLFYSYQFAQLCITLLCYYLSYALARKLGIKPLLASILVFCLFVFNLPLFRNLTQNQVNLWILVSILLAMLWIDRLPILAGMVISLGTHLKIYPIIMLIPWVLNKKWKALSGFTFMFIGIFLLETSGGRDFRLWQDFFEYMGHIEKGVALRNNSITSFTYNLSRLFLNSRPEALSIFAPILANVITVLLLGWVSYRFFKYFRYQNQVASSRLLDLMMESIFLMFFISPSVWDHHFISAIPIIIWAFARFPQQKYPSLVFAAVCIFLVPTFDVFIFSYIRLFGLLLLFYQTDPLSEISGFASVS